jgi:hypothetical protein
MRRDDELRDYLSRSGVKWTPLDEEARAAAENQWRDIYSSAFVGRPRLREGAKADFEYKQEACEHFLIMPLTANVSGLPMSRVIQRSLGGYDCRGPLVPLGHYHHAELVVCPVDFSWTMIHTHEDYGFGGPYFIRRDWIP